MNMIKRTPEERKRIIKFAPIDKGLHGLKEKSLEAVPPWKHKGYASVVAGVITGRYKYYNVAYKYSMGGIVTTFSDAVKQNLPLSTRLEQDMNAAEEEYKKQKEEEARVKYRATPKSLTPDSDDDKRDADQG